MEKIVKDIQALRQKSTDVTSVDEARELIKRLEYTLTKIPHGVGLASVQIGIPKRVGVIRYKDKMVHLINPSIIEQKEEFIFPQEGCLSFPNTFKHTKRYKHTTIKHLRIEDDEFKEETAYFYFSEDPKDINSDGLLAIAVQHEMEHFDGKLTLDHNYEYNFEPLKRDTAKVGRNEPCPCGSGLKFKKCCG